MFTSDQEDGNEVWSIVPWEKLDLAFGGPWVKKVRVSVCTSKVRVVFYLTPEAGLPYDIISGKTDWRSPSNLALGFQLDNPMRQQ